MCDQPCADLILGLLEACLEGLDRPRLSLALNVLSLSVVAARGHCLGATPKAETKELAFTEFPEGVLSETRKRAFDIARFSSAGKW